jgi:shikimate dehydrogenase
MADRYAVIGHPVAHSKSPWIHAEFARATGQALEYRRIEAPLEGFARSVDEFRATGGRGANVTLPFKHEACLYCRNAVTERARAAGVVNTLMFRDGAVHGDNTDGVGLLRDITVNLGRALEGRRVLLMGAGGAAQGVLGPLLAAAPQRLVVANRSAGKARSLALRFGAAAGGSYEEFAGERFDVLINATSAGLAGEAPPLPEGAFAPGALGYDMVYGRATPFLALARAAGAEACDGLGMLVEQAAESFLLWRGLRPDTAPVLAALRRR